MLKGPVHYNKLIGLSLNELQKYEKIPNTHSFAEKSSESSRLDITISKVNLKRPQNVLTTN